VTVDRDAAPVDERGAEGVRVVLADAHDLFRTGLRDLLEEQGVEVIGEAENGQDAIRCVRELAPEVVVMALNLPGISGFEATRQINAIAPLTRVLVLTISDQESDVLDAILAGACGYLLKDSSLQELIAGIRAASIGESPISPHIASKVFQRVRSTSSVRAIAETIRAELSDREIEVLKLKLTANGKDNAQIAAELHISPKTVTNHISNILMKLQILAAMLSLLVLGVADASAAIDQIATQDVRSSRTTVHDMRGKVVFAMPGECDANGELCTSVRGNTIYVSLTHNTYGGAVRVSKTTWKAWQGRRLMGIIVQQNSRHAHIYSRTGRITGYANGAYPVRTAAAFLIFR
jgi:DNA-binding NarL/FixJ family response regulator